MPNTSEINKSLTDLEHELSKLKSASDEIRKTKEYAQSSILESKDLLKQTISNIEDSLAALAVHINEYEKLSENLLNSAQKNNEIVVTEAERLKKSAVELYNNVDNMREKIDKINFPNRLDKLDTAVTGINTVIQNLFGRFESVERNLKDELQAKTADLEKTFTVTETKIIDDFNLKTSKLENCIASTEENLRNDLTEDFDNRISQTIANIEESKKINLILFISVLTVTLGSLITLLVKFVF